MKTTGRDVYKVFISDKARENLVRDRIEGKDSIPAVFFAGIFLGLGIIYNFDAKSSK
jgi:hypothetical protein